MSPEILEEDLNKIEEGSVYDEEWDPENGIPSKVKNFKGERDVRRPTSDIETLIHLLKGNVGSGSLAMPQAFLNAGLWVGFVGVPIIGLFCIHCMHILLHSSRELCRRTGAGSLNYAETAELSFRLGPSNFQPWSKVFLRIIKSFLVVTQLGFCCVYFVFVSQNMYQAIECMTGGTNFSQFDYMLITLVPVILVCYIPDLKLLAPISIIAASSQVIGMVIIFYYLVRDLPEVEMKDPAFAGWSTLPLFFGTAMYAFEGIGLVLPLENNMKTPSHFPGWNGVLNSGMIIVVCVYTSLGFYGYLRYGNTVLGSITLNLPGDEGLAQAVKILMSFAIFLTYPLQFYVALTIMLPFVLKKFTTKKYKLVAEYVFRSGLVLLTFALAAAIPNIGLFTNLIGAVCASTLALIFPPLIDSVITWPNKGKYNWKLYKNIIISGMGILGFVTGAFSSVKDIVHFFQSDDQGIETGCSL